MAKCSVGWASFRHSTAGSTEQHASQPSQSYTPATNHGFSGTSGSRKRKAPAESEPARRKPEMFRRARDTRHPIFSLTQHITSKAKQKGPTDDGGLFVDDDDDISMVDAPQPQNAREAPVLPRVENPNLISGQAQATVRLPIVAQGWEMAPGRIRSITAESMENIAFSDAYLRGSRPVQITRELFFRVIRLEVGETLRMEPDAENTRACSLAAGRLAVELPGESSFDIGQHGVFIVKAGAAVKIINKHYDTAVLHVTAVQE